MIVLILAGGGGTRLWPLSRQSFPKQFLDFGAPLSLLQRTALRFLKETDRVIIATSDQYSSIVKSHLKSIDKPCEIIVEPCRRNTAPAIAYAIRYMEQVLKIKEDEIVLVLPSDHLIEPESVFLDYLEKVKCHAMGHSVITFGIKPSKAETGYGYIEIGEKFDDSSYKIKKFIEKPNQERANRYVSSDQYYWNSGMFLFSIQSFWRELKVHSPDIYTLAKRNIEEVRENYPLFPDLSIDYAVMEKSQDILLCPLPISWSDIGSWDALCDVLEKDIDQNMKIGNVLSIDTQNSLIISNKRLISTIGLDNLIIIETDDALLICKRGESQRVKEMVSTIKSGPF